MKPDFAQLTLLVDIIDSGNLSEAARRLRMTRANVSYHLAQLEKAVGAQLVRRTTRRMEPTEVGWRLYGHGRAIRDELALAQDAVLSLGRGLRGRVGLGVPSGYGHMVMGEWLVDFKREYPGVVLDVLFENRTEHLRDDLDIAIRVLSAPPAHMVAREFGSVRYLACARPDVLARHGKATRLEDLRHMPVIASNAVGAELVLRGWRTGGGAREQVALHPVVISDHHPFLRQSVLAGLGVGLLPDYVMADAIASGEVVTMLDDYRLSIYGGKMFLLYLPSRHQTQAVRACIDFLMRRAASHARGSAGGDAPSQPPSQVAAVSAAASAAAPA